MQILGIRSFDNRVPETIEFFTPLTLIVGLNGSGKTTIIECLKFATIGELPANSDRGKAFIHDPNLVNEKEILAQVRLAFKSTTGAKMVATRNLQLSVKKTNKTLSRSIKALETQLMIIRNGERTSISSRYFGISPAIIEYVIFCHQDDSLWPMSEPSALKKRFDEIFEALKYTKAVENLKLIQKKQNEELGKHKIVEQHAKEDKDRGERAEKRSEELYDEIERLRESANDLETKVKEAGARTKEAWDHAAKFEKIVAKLEGKRIEAEALGSSVEDLQRNIKEMSETDEQLQDHLDNYEERVALYEQDSQTQRERWGDISQQMEKARGNVEIKQSELGRYQAQKEQHEINIGKRSALIKETAHRHGIRGFDLDEVTSEHVQDFMERIGRMAREQKAALESARREKEAEQQEAQRVLNELEQRRSILRQNKDNSKTQIAANDEKIAAVQEKINGVDIDEGRKAAFESSIEDTAGRLAKAKSDFDAAKWDEKIREADNQLRDLEDRKDKLDAEMVDGTRQAGDSARLDFIQKELKERERSLETMSRVHGDRLTQILGRGWDPRTLEQEFQSAVRTNAEQVRDAELQRDGTSRELEQVDAKLTDAKKNQKQKSEESKRCRDRICDAFEEEPDLPDSFPEVLRAAEQNYEIRKTDQNNFTIMKKYYEQAKAVFETQHKCRLCRRPLQEQKDIEEFFKVVRKGIASATDEDFAQELEEVEEYVHRAKETQPSYDIWLRLKDELPSLDTECQTLTSRRNALLSKVEEQDSVLQERQAAKRDVESMTKTVQNMTRYHTDIRSFQAQIEELSTKQKESGGSRGLEVIQDELKKVNDGYRTVKATLSQLSTDKERGRDLINRLELSFRDIKAKLSEAEYQLKEKTSLLTQIGDLKSLIAEQRESMRRNDQDIQALLPQIDQAKAKYEDITRRGTEREAELSRDLIRLQDSERDLRAADQEIWRYIDGGGDQNLARARREIEYLREKVKDLENEQREITVEAKKIEEQLRSHSETKRQITDNIRYRTNRRQLEAVRIEIEELEQHNVEGDKTRYEREGSRWQHKRNELSAEQASIIGTLKSKDDQLKQLVNDWETDYKDAAYKYKEAHIRVETTKAVIQDLSRYGGALDQAIVKYHSLKLEEINRVIEELWKKTYQGTDVDSILIRSEPETLQKTKSYNYRVVMVKQDVEMDMRGRCSAGQKVLASIIIRLALAECFGVNCGLIALDEPTTNLDRENIRALASSLAEIIRFRRSQRNFQLIVITHDEEFLREMQCADFCDFYYHVSRNERQKSVIKRQSIADVM
ncbi:DNA repair protein Rad50 [Saccharata proteae CBS 121410]|uniref:DNA repair protein RAD50 n=1 Tax=Saccharata proteae CBS 121410 TaxID=1314787 RepID=A0A9P4M2X2_9PEZI|nr:DNA repair protein Rad50 [Saccharata proteae CBS 121410]